MCAVRRSVYFRLCEFAIVNLAVSLQFIKSASVRVWGHHNQISQIYYLLTISYGALPGSIINVNNNVNVDEICYETRMGVFRLMGGDRWNHIS